MKTYGDAPCTLSTSTSILALLKPELILVSAGVDGKRYVNFVALVIPVITLLPLYNPEPIPVTLTESSTDNPWDSVVSMVAMVPAAVTLVIAILSSLRSPTILNSGLFGSKSVAVGKSVILLFSVVWP